MNAKIGKFYEVEKILSVKNMANTELMFLLGVWGLMTCFIT